MDFEHEIHEEENLIKNIFNRFRKRDFKGTTGQAIKNSTFQLSQNLIFKIGSLIFTIIVARLLLPERMGLYNLALSTIVLLGVFSDMGIGNAVITYGAKMLGIRRLGKAKGYAKVLFKWKLYLSFISSAVLLALSYFISEYYYQKPIFFALLVGALYIPIVALSTFVENLFKTTENFKIPMFKEILFQVTRFVIVPLAILLFLNSDLSNQGFVVVTLLAIVFSYLISLFFLVSNAKRKIGFLEVHADDLNSKEILDLKKFIYPLSATALAGAFFGYIDTLMLGRFVSTEYIAYYGAAFSLISSGAAIIGFASTALLPIFSRKTGSSLENIFRKTRNFVVLISILGTIFAYSISYYAIRYAYGIEYLTAVPLLRWFSLLVLFIPVLTLYASYFVSQKRTKELAMLLFGSTILNILFNIFGIHYGLNHYGEMGALYGALAATILSRVIYLAGFFVLKKARD